MPKVKAIEDAKSSLEQELRSLCERHRTHPALVPSLRELSERHGLSKSLVQRVVRALCAEGLLYPVHGMGTFVGARPLAVERVFLFLYDQGTRDAQIRSGFEGRMSALGGVTLAISLEAAIEQRERGQLPPVQGVWDPSFDVVARRNLHSPVGAAIVGLSGRVDPERGIGVGFDEVGGGRQAARHLMDLGARKLTLLGVHAKDAPAGALDWSRQRAEGFEQAVRSVGLEDVARILLPKRLPMLARTYDPYDYFEMGREMGRTMELRGEQEGVVCVNDRVAYGFLTALINRGVPAHEVPPTIGFDSQECHYGTYVSSMVFSWHDLGRSAADVLFGWTSSSGRPATKVEPVPMGQLTRLSSRPRWLAQAPALLDALRHARQESDLL